MEPLSLDLMLAKFIVNINEPILRITYVGCYVFGVYLLMKGFLKCVKYSDEGSRGQQKFSGIWGTFLFGAAIIAVPDMMSTVSNTMLMDTSNAEPALSYAFDNQDIQEKVQRTYWVIITFVQMLGLISFTRGLSILRSVTDGNTQVTSMAGITHVIAGAIAWNLGEFTQMLSNTIGFNILTGTPI